MLFERVVMLFEEKKSHFWLVQYSKGLKFWKEAWKYTSNHTLSKTQVGKMACRE